MMQIWPIQFILTLQKNTSYKVKQYTQRKTCQPGPRFGQNLTSTGFGLIMMFFYFDMLSSFIGAVLGVCVSKLQYHQGSLGLLSYKSNENYVHVCKLYITSSSPEPWWWNQVTAD